MLTIHREKQPDKLIRMGHAPVVILPTPVPAEQANSEPGWTPEQFARLYPDLSEDERQKILSDSVVFSTPPEPVKNKPGRKKMAKDLEEVGTKTIRKDGADEQGAIGTHGRNAPAQEKVPETSSDKGEDKDDGR